MNQDGALGRAIAVDVYRGAIFEINRRDPDLGIVLQHHHECIEDAKQSVSASKTEQRWFAGIIISILLSLVAITISVARSVHT